MFTGAAIPVCRRHFPEERRRRTIRRVSSEQKIKVLLADEEHDAGAEEIEVPVQKYLVQDTAEQDVPGGKAGSRTGEKRDHAPEASEAEQ